MNQINMITNVLEYLERAAEEHPDKKAFSDEHGDIAYGKLTETARRGGSFLAETLQERNRPVAVLIDRNVNTLIAFMSIVYSGNFYCPVDVNLPRGRQELIMETLQPACLINAAGGSAEYAVKTFSMEEITGGDIREEVLADIRNSAIDTDPLYAIFTSGSTGVPKGVLVCHRSVIDLAEQFSRTFHFTEDTIIGNQAPFDFDVSTKDIYVCLSKGASLEVIPKKLFSLPGLLVQYLEDRKITTIFWAVSAMRIIENFKAFDRMTPGYLRQILFSGEVMSNKVLNYWRRYIPDAMYVNLYGPTEITCNCTYYIVDREFADDETLPIGKAFRNTGVFLLGEDGKPIREAGKEGELCVRGTCLALGYYRNPEKTEEAFTPNPCNGSYSEKIYHTGDMARYNEKNELEFCSRKDYQIKHMGHRIELGEIEIIVNSLSFIDAACCVHDSVEGKIYLFYQAGEACDKRIIEGLKEKLPKYMWPNRYCYMECLPVNKNGKIDRVRLKEEYIGKNSEREG
jgi:Non-ribosomal peptide synthetase modules and related proteins